MKPLFHKVENVSTNSTKLSARTIEAAALSPIIFCIPKSLTSPSSTAKTPISDTDTNEMLNHNLNIVTHSRDKFLIRFFDVLRGKLLSQCKP